MNASLKTVSISALLVAAACGGSGSSGDLKSNPALTKTFNYGTPATPAPGETNAANSASQQLMGTKDLSTSPNADAGQSLATLPDNVASQALGSASGFSIPVPGGESFRPLQGATLATTPTNPCITTTPTSVKYTNCPVGQGFTLNGAFNATKLADGSNLAWDIALTGSNTSNGTTVTLDYHLVGNIDATSSTIKGTAVSDFDVKANVQGQSVHAALSTGLRLDLGYAANPFCINSGTMNINRVWTAKPQGATGKQYDDISEQFIWSGCNSVKVAHST